MLLSVFIDKLQAQDNIQSPYIVIAQKAFFSSSNANGGVGPRKQAYLVEGEQILALKKTDGYVYCEFTNSSTHKTTKGWICKSDIEKLSNQAGAVQVNSVDATSPYISLVKLDRTDDDVKKVYNNPIISKTIKKIMGVDYSFFVNNFLSNPIVGEVFVRHNVLYIRSFEPHAGIVNAHFFIDLKENKSFLYWNTLDKNYKSLLKTYGDTPISSGIVNFIQLQKIDNKDFMDGNDVATFNQILKYGPMQ